MKTLLLSFLMLFSLNIFAQDQPFYLRAENVTLGFRTNENTEITWFDEQNDCSILVECYKTKIIINSQKLQTYYILYQLSHDEQTTVWRCKSLNGTTCNVRMSSDPVYPGLLALMVEFDDAVWFYICKRD
jgi:hypothetical protein